MTWCLVPTTPPIPDALSLDEVAVIGHSLGGMFALWHVAAGSKRISEVVAIGEPAVALPGDLPLAEVPNIDSLRLLQAIALLEEQFSIEIEVVALERLQRVRDIVAIISDALPEE